MLKHVRTVATWVLLYGGIAGLSCDTTKTETPYSGTDSERVRVVFSEGHYTEPIDHGRPVTLIAGALEVAPEVFREAFRGVQPAHGRGPTREEAQRNKAALMGVLGPHGITNDRLDTVSNYYRYRPQNGEMWPTTEAVAYAMVEDGAVVSFEIEDGGSGYSSPPIVNVPGIPGYQATTELSFSTRFDKNGSVRAMVLPGRYGN